MEDKEDITELKSLIVEINTKLDKLLQLFESQNNNSKKMSTHIDFIETTYNSIKTPFNFIMSAVNKTLVIRDTE